MRERADGSSDVASLIQAASSDRLVILVCVHVTLLDVAQVL